MLDICRKKTVCIKYDSHVKPFEFTMMNYVVVCTTSLIVVRFMAHFDGAQMVLLNVLRN